jgi:hypothetical protein
MIFTGDKGKASGGRYIGLILQTPISKVSGCTICSASSSLNLGGIISPFSIFSLSSFTSSAAFGGAATKSIFIVANPITTRNSGVGGA